MPTPMTNSTAPIGAKTLPQKKIRHWRLYVGHNTHMDIGYNPEAVKF